MSPQVNAAAEIQSIVRVSFLLRLVTLLACLLGLVNQRLTPLAAGAIVLLALTSMAGIYIKAAPAVLQGHPFLVVLDGVVMTVLMVVLGVNNPLILLALSSCVIIGVVLAPLTAGLSTVAMIAGYLTAALSNGRDVTFLSALGLPITFVSMVVLGQAFRNVAERKRQSERAVADLVTGAAAAQERARLARELHDSTAKTLQGLALTARSLDHWIFRDPERAAAEARDIADSADYAMVRLRELLSKLRQDDLDQPFHESLAALSRDVVSAHGVRASLELEPIPLSAPGVRYELLAAAREAITNAAVHSGADKVTVIMTNRGDEVSIEIKDTGCGFSMDILGDRERDGHFGVRGFSERLALIGGHAEVTSSPGSGSRVLLQAPLMGLQEVGG